MNAIFPRLVAPAVRQREDGERADRRQVLADLELARRDHVADLVHDLAVQRDAVGQADLDVQGSLDCSSVPV